MSETLAMILSACLLVAVFALTRYIIARKFQRASWSIIRQLEAKSAIDPESAVELPYRTPNVLRIGLRDYHSKSLQYMIRQGIVGATETGKFFLLVRPPQPKE